MRQEPEEPEPEAAADEAAADHQATPQPGADGSADEQAPGGGLHRVDSTLQGLGGDGGWGLPGGGKASAQFWEVLLKDKVQAMKEEELAQMGRGRRVRCEVRYMEMDEDNWDRISQDEWRRSRSVESGSSDYEMEVESDGGVGRGGGKQQGRKRTVMDLYNPAAAAGGGGVGGMGGGVGMVDPRKGTGPADLLAAAAAAALDASGKRYKRKIDAEDQQQQQALSLRQQQYRGVVLQPLPEEAVVELMEGSGEGLKVLGFSREERQRFLGVVWQHGFCPAGPEPEKVWEHYTAALPGKSLTQVGWGWVGGWGVGEKRGGEGALVLG